MSSILHIIARKIPVQSLTNVVQFVKSNGSNFFILITCFVYKYSAIPIAVGLPFPSCPVHEQLQKCKMS